MLDKIGKPQQIYHDNEGYFSSIEFQWLLNEDNIKQTIVSTSTFCWKSSADHQ